MRVEPGRDEGPDLIEDVRQGDEEGDHQRHLHRHQENADHVGGDHLPAARQLGQQGLRQQGIQILGPGEQAQENDQDRQQGADETVAKLDEV